MVTGAKMNEHVQQGLNWAAHIASLSTIIATIVGWLPAIVSVLAAVWYGIQIYQSATVQKWLAARRLKKIERTIRRLEKLRSSREV